MCNASQLQTATIGSCITLVALAALRRSGLQYNVAGASSFRNIKHKFPNKFCKRQHQRCQGYAPQNVCVLFCYKDVRATLLFCYQTILKPYWTCKLVCNIKVADASSFRNIKSLMYWNSRPLSLFERLLAYFECPKAQNGCVNSIEQLGHKLQTCANIGFNI